MAARRAVVPVGRAKRWAVAVRPMPAVKVARLYQVENALDAIISANLQASMPMIGDTTK